MPDSAIPLARLPERVSALEAVKDIHSVDILQQRQQYQELASTVTRHNVQLDHTSAGLRFLSDRIIPDINVALAAAADETSRIRAMIVQSTADQSWSGKIARWAIDGMTVLILGYIAFRLGIK